MGKFKMLEDIDSTAFQLIDAQRGGVCSLCRKEARGYFNARTTRSCQMDEVMIPVVVIPYGGIISRNSPAHERSAPPWKMRFTEFLSLVPVLGGHILPKDAFVHGTEEDMFQ